MKKYYIATSTLNFNNIFSSESISPKSFYEQRNFGYSRWTEIHEDVSDNIIILYDKPFSFTRPASDVEDHPMLIEIETDCNFEQIDDGVYYCDKTIYLNPQYSRFIFFYEKDRKVAFSISESSIETKLLKIYNKRIEVAPSFLSNNSLFCNKIDKECNFVSIEEDKKNNKMKGLLYGYYIGGYLSEDTEIVKKRNDFQDLLELFSVIRTRSNAVPTMEEKEQLEQLLLSVQSNLPHLKEYIALRSDVESAFPNKHRAFFTYIEHILKKYDGFIGSKEILPLLKDEIDIKADTPKPNQAIEWLKCKKGDFEKSIIHKLISIDNEEIIVVDKNLAKINNENLNEVDKMLFINWVNEVLCNEQYNSKISTFNKELSDTLTITAKEKLGEKWDSSQEKIVLNNIRKYIAGQDVEIDWKNDLYSSLAAVLKEGNDWEKLLRFMQRKGITDYRLAFAIYGELNGFASLPRDFTDVLFELEKYRDYIWKLYREITGQLLGDQIEKKVGTAQTNSIPDETVQAAPKEEPMVSSQKEEQNDTGEFDNFKKDFFKTCPAAKKDEKIYEELYHQSGGINDTLKKLVEEDTRLNKGKGVQKNVKKYLANLLKEEDQTMSNLTLFPEISSTGKFLDDFDYLSKNEDFIQLVSDKKDWKKDLEWFIKAHNPKHKDYEKYYKNKPNDNNTIITQFVTLKKSIYKKAESFLRKLYTDVNR